MNKLEIGDLVKTYSNDGEIVFSPVITFLDQDIDYKGYFPTVIVNFHFALIPRFLCTCS